MIHGSCLCRGVQYEAERVTFFGHCHCSMCRKAHGAAFATFAGIPADGFRFIQGADLVRLYESSPGSYRAFCSVCGSNAPSKSTDGKMVWVAAGAFDDDPGTRPTLHMFVGSKAPWWDIADDLPQHEKYPQD